MPERSGGIGVTKARRGRRSRRSGPVWPSARGAGCAVRPRRARRRVGPIPARYRDRSPSLPARVGAAFSQRPRLLGPAQVARARPRAALSGAGTDEPQERPPTGGAGVIRASARIQAEIPTASSPAVRPDEPHGLGDAPGRAGQQGVTLAPERRDLGVPLERGGSMETVRVVLSASTRLGTSAGRSEGNVIGCGSPGGARERRRTRGTSQCLTPHRRRQADPFD